MHTLTRPFIQHLFVLGLVALVAAGCGNANGSDETPSDAEQRRTRIETLRLEPTTFDDVIELTGAVASLNDAVLSAQTAGTVTAVAERGTRVGQGDVVARIDPGMMSAALQQAEAQLEAARASYEIAEDTYQRQEPLYRDSIISALEFENVKAQRNQALAGVRQAEAALAQAQEQYSHTLVRAPFSGIVEDRFIELGEQVNPGQQVVRVVSTSRVKVVAGVPERYAGEIEAGTPVEMNFTAYGSDPRIGRVTFAGAAINPQSRTFPIEIEVDNREGQLKPEMVAQLRVIRETRDDALVVPRPAVIRDETGTSVFVVNNGTAERRPVTTGSSYAGKLLIESGLEAGDEVVVLGQNNLTDGDPVNVVEQYNRVGAAGVPMKVSATVSDSQEGSE